MFGSLGISMQMLPYGRRYAGQLRIVLRPAILAKFRDHLFVVIDAFIPTLVSS